MNNKQRIELKNGFPTAAKALEAISILDSEYRRTFKKALKSELSYSIGGALKADTHSIVSYNSDQGEINWMKSYLNNIK
jgi:hypothetical protein